MKKLTFLLIAALGFVGLSNAQFSAGLNVGTFKFTEDGAESINGFNLSANYALDDDSRVGLNFGNYWESTDILGVTLTSYIRPITVSYQRDIDMNGKLKPYYGAQIGLYSFGASFGDESNSESYIGGAAVGGVRFFVNDNIGLNAGVKYHLISLDGSTEGAFGLNLGVDYFF